MITVRRDYNDKPIFERWRDGYVWYVIPKVVSIVEAGDGYMIVRLIPTDEFDGPFETKRKPGEIWDRKGVEWKIQL